MDRRAVRQIVMNWSGPRPVVALDVDLDYICDLVGSFGCGLGFNRLHDMQTNRMNSSRNLGYGHEGMGILCRDALVVTGVLPSADSAEQLCGFQKSPGESVLCTFNAQFCTCVDGCRLCLLIHIAM